MTTNFTRQHVAMLLRYAGISFISGAVNHGFFSGERSLWTAATGITLFVLASWADARNGASGAGAGATSRVLIWGALLSVGLGFFTGGLQHFPDSPSRSAWVVPVGFVLSALAFMRLEPFRPTRALAAYLVVASLAVGTGSWVAGRQLTQVAGAEAAHHHLEAGAPTPGNGITGRRIDRTVEVRASDTMRFTPADIRAREGETIRVVVRNDGAMPHEWVLGSPAAIEQHAKEMRGGHADHGGGIVGASVAPGQVAELVVTFESAGPLQVACLVPGHYEAGMRGSVDVVAQAAPALPATQDKVHGHDGHKH
jgi:uncharacterized cupredoxin-like copper-binding protein